MASQYPAQIDNNSTLPLVVDNSTPLTASVVNILQNTIIRIETTIGIQPNTIYSSVAARLDAIEGSINSLNVISLSGDLGGTTTDPLVIGIQGFAISSNTPTSGQVLQYNGSSWTPTTLASSFTAGGDISGTPSSQTVIGFFNRPLSANVPTIGQSYLWNGTEWAPGTVSSFTAAGDLSGSGTSQRVIGFYGVPLASSVSSPVNNDVITYSSSSSQWVLQASSNLFTPSGDLSGSGTAQYIKSISGNVGGGGTVAINTGLLQFNASQATPTITQASLVSGNGGNLTFNAQGTNSGKGGNVIINGGATASGTGGVVAILGGIGTTQSDVYPGSSSVLILDGSTENGFLTNTFGVNVFTADGGAPIYIGGFSPLFRAKTSIGILNSRPWLTVSTQGLSLRTNIISGSQTYAIDSIALPGDASLAPTPDYFIITDGYNGPIDIQLPLASMVAGRILVVQDGYGNAGTYNTTITPEGGPTINGMSSYVLNENYQSVQITSDGYNWLASVSATGNTFTAAGDLSGSNSTQTVIGIQGVAISGTAPSNGQVLTATSSSTANWQSISASFMAGGDLSGSSTDQTVIGLQTIPVLSGTPDDGYVLTYSAFSNRWQPEAVTTGDVSLAGDVIGEALNSTVVAIQNQPVLSTDPATVGNYGTNLTNAMLAWDGYHWAPQQPAVYTYVGKNSPSADITLSDLIDDTPYVQELINAFSVGTGQAIGNVGVYFNWVNTVFLTSLDLSPLQSSDTSATINIYGTHRFLQGKAELYVVNGVTLQGAGSPGSTGNAFVPSGGAGILGFASNGAFGPEPTSGTNDGYVDSNYYSLAFFIFQASIPPLSSDLLGETFTVTSASAPAYEGSNWMFVADSSEDAVNIYGYLVWIGSGAAPTGGASAVSWSIGSGPSLRTGTAATFDSIGNSTVIRVWNTAPMNTFRHQYIRAWMGLSNVNSVLLGTGLFRVMGWDKAHNSAFVMGLPLFLNGFVGPDYGIGGSSGDPKIQTYWANAAITLSDHNTVSTFGIAAGGPAIMIGGGDGDQNYVVNNCFLSTFGSSCGVPLIIDSVFWVYINNCTLSNQDAPNLPACIYLTGSVNNNTYTGIVKFTNIQTDGFVIFSEGPYITVNTIELDQVICEHVPLLPGRDYAAIVALGVCGNDGDWYFHYSGTADSGGPCYMIESFYPVYNAVLNGGQGASVPDIYIDTSFGLTTGVGPILGVGTDSINNNGSFGFTATPPWNTSMINSGVIDGQMIGNGDDFSPVITLPYQLPLQPLATVADWEALAGIATVSDVDVDGYQIIGPDGRPGFYIRLTGAPNYRVLGNWNNTNIPNVQFGDTFICFARIKGTDVNDFAPTGGIIMQVGTGYALQNNELAMSITNNAIFPQYAANRWGGQWLDVCGQATIVHVDGDPADFDFAVVMYPSDTGTDLIIDPESIAVLYFPVGTTLNDGYNSGSSNTIAEYIRLYRKIRRQVTGATIGDVAIPSRNGLSFGASQSAGSRIQTDGYTTSSTSATTMFSYAVPTSQAFNITVDWTAIVPSAVSSGRISGGSFMVIGYNNAGSITFNLQTIGTNYNCGSSGAAASTPITVTTSGSMLDINVVADTTSVTDWQFSIRQTNCS